MDKQHGIFQEAVASHHLGEGQDVMHCGNGKMENQQEIKTVVTSMKIPSNPNGKVDHDQELKLQDDGKRLHSGNGAHMPNQLQQDPEHTSKLPQIVLQANGNVNGDEDGNFDGQFHGQFQEPFGGQGDHHGHNDYDTTSQQDEHVMSIRYFDIWLHHYPISAPISIGTCCCLAALICNCSSLF